MIIGSYKIKNKDDFNYLQNPNEGTKRDLVSARKKLRVSGEMEPVDEERIQLQKEKGLINKLIGIYSRKDFIECLSAGNKNGGKNKCFDDTKLIFH